MNNLVLEFIERFHIYDKHGVLDDTFLNGFCYYFAVILQERFGGEILYDPVEGHFVTRIIDEEFRIRLYDITGDVTNNYDWDRLLDKTDWMRNGSTIRGCILKGSSM